MARDDFDDRPVRGSGELGPLDKLFRDTNTAIIVVFGLCCGTVALILGLVGYFTAKDPVAKQKALIVVIIQVVIHVLAIIANVAGLLGGVAAGAR